MIEIIILGILVVILYVINMVVNNESIKSWVGSLLIMLSCLLGYSTQEYLSIPSIEVYRGNTELEITYRNDEPIDSIVVWKNK